VFVVSKILCSTLSRHSGTLEIVQKVQVQKPLVGARYLMQTLDDVQVILFCNKTWIC